MCKMNFIGIGVMAASLAALPGQAAMRQYSASPDTSNWTLDRTTRLSCQLNHEVPYYGDAVFRVQASKDKALNFNLDMVVRPDGYDIAGLVSVPPKWHPGEASRELASMQLLKQFDGELDNKTAWLMLSELDKGNQPTFYYQDWQNVADKIAVSLSSVNFRQAYWAFLQCRDELLPYSFEDIAFTVMNYKSNSSELTKASKKRLAQIGDYLKYDPSIESITISAYADSYGGRDKNLQLTRKRALAIKEYMIATGVPKDKVQTEGFGEKRHVATNDTILGRAKNRRVVIQLAKP